MLHLDDAQILSCLEGSASAESIGHLASCPQCGELAQLWRQTLGDLREVATSAPSPAQLHRLGALYRAHGPKRRSIGSILATLVVQRPAALALRGPEQSMRHYRAGEHELILEHHREAAHGDFRLIAQVLGDDPGGALWLSGPEFEGSYTIDSFGTVQADQLPPGRYRLRFDLGDREIEIQELVLGEGSSDA